MAYSIKGVDRFDPAGPLPPEDGGTASRCISRVPARYLVNSHAAPATAFTTSVKRLASMVSIVSVGL